MRDGAATSVGTDGITPVHVPLLGTIVFRRGAFTPEANWTRAWKVDHSRISKFGMTYGILVLCNSIKILFIYQYAVVVIMQLLVPILLLWAFWIVQWNASLSYHPTSYVFPFGDMDDIWVPVVVCRSTYT